MFESKYVVEVIQAKRFKMEGYEATTLYCIGENINEADSCGTELVKVIGEFDLLDHIRGHLPGKIELTTTLVQGGKDKGSVKVLSAVPAKQAATKTQ